MISCALATVLVSSYSIVLLVFLAVKMSASPEFFPFETSDETLNSVILAIFFYVFVLFGAGFKHMRSRKRQSAQEPVHSSSGSDEIFNTSENSPADKMAIE